MLLYLALVSALVPCAFSTSLGENPGGMFDVGSKVQEVDSIKLACPLYWTAYPGDDTCLRAMNVKSNFINARRTCKGYGGDLVKIRDDDKKDFIYSKIYPDGWVFIGVQDEYHDNHFTYIDGSDLPGRYYTWAAGEPVRSKGMRTYCVALTDKTDRKWQPVACGKELGFVCQMNPIPIEPTTTSEEPTTTTEEHTTTTEEPTTTTEEPTTTTEEPKTTTEEPTTTTEEPTTPTEKPTTTTEEPTTTTEKPTTTTKEAAKSGGSRCADCWVHNTKEEVCLKVVNEKKLSFSEARKYCQGKGGDLVTVVRDEEQTTFVSDLLHKDTKYWIGLFDRYSYVNGKPLGDYHVFLNEFRFNGHEFCVDMRNNEWNFSRCFVKRNFVCQRSVEQG